MCVEALTIRSNDTDAADAKTGTADITAAAARITEKIFFSILFIKNPPFFICNNGYFNTFSQNGQQKYVHFVESLQRSLFKGYKFVNNYNDFVTKM